MPPDRGAEVEPGAVTADLHVEIAAEGRVPALDRRQAAITVLVARGPRDQGPRGEGPPARDDRGGGKEREGFGISGFKNSPFAKLGTLKTGR